jgi:hypothetical protein
MSPNGGPQCGLRKWAPHNRSPRKTRRVRGGSECRAHRKQKRAASFDDLIGLREQGGRQSEPERLRGFHVDHQLRSGRLHHRQFGRLLIFKVITDKLASYGAEKGEVMPGIERRPHKGLIPALVGNLQHGLAINS